MACGRGGAGVETEGLKTKSYQRKPAVPKETKPEEEKKP
jgi:hypothetical protein